MTPQEITTWMHHLCTLAERETLPRFRTKTQIDNKLDQGFDPVTEADKAAETVIRNAIMQQFPDHGILGEEHGTHNENAEYCWIIDPIDGTKAFISGLPVWGTLIGLYKDGTPLAGIMHQPFTEERYFCDGTASYLKHAGGEKKLATSGENTVSQAILMSTFPYFEDKVQARFDALRNACKLTRYGTDCYAYCMLASGSIDLVAEYGLATYDIAALIPIIEKAGGIITNWEGGSAAQGGSVLACANKELHIAALEKLNA